MKTRIISAIIAILIAIPVIYFGGNLFVLMCSLLGVIGYYELLKARKEKRDIPFFIKAVGMILFAMTIMNTNNRFMFMDYLIPLITFVLIIPIVFYNKDKRYNIEDALAVIGMTLFLGLSFNKFISVRIDNLYYFLYIILVPIITDTFAYFTGVFFGKHKMSPTVSPNKTWEGFAGGLAFGTIISTVYYMLLINEANIIVVLLTSLLLSVAGQIGDLVFSSIKRYYGIKDYGNIMPGHGGVLDRLDSVLFVSLAFMFLSRFI